MSRTEEVEFVGRLLDAYAATAWRQGVAGDGADRGVPPAMQVGDVDPEGWIEWQMLPSTLTNAEVRALEQEFRIGLPPLFRAYLLARFQLFDQVRSGRYAESILMPATPHGRPLQPLRQELSAWKPLIDADLIPFAQWGDGYGPTCFDVRQRQPDGDCPIVWLDHEVIIPLGEERMRDRAALLPHVKPLYGSCREMLLDLFGGGEPSSNTAV